MVITLIDSVRCEPLCAFFISSCVYGLIPNHIICIAGFVRSKNLDSDTGYSVEKVKGDWSGNESVFPNRTITIAVLTDISSSLYAVGIIDFQFQFTISIRNLESLNFFK